VIIDGEMWGTDWGQSYGRMRSAARIEGLLKALRTVIRVRGLDPTEAQWARMERCRSTKQLLRYIGRAAFATTGGQLFRRIHDHDHQVDDPFEVSKEGPWVFVVRGQDENASRPRQRGRSRTAPAEISKPDRKNTRTGHCSA